ncbi:MAG: signal peptide peptidase SppA [Bacteroidales bacterium]|nr:signal peptide peptidase SppA [Bacteroidales bacterium]
MRRLIIAVCTVFMAISTLSGADTNFLKGKILKIDLKDVVAERGGSSFSISLSGLNVGSSVSLLGFERALEEAADDDAIAMIYMNTDHFSASMAGMEEIREYLKRFSAKGKPVVAYGAGFSNASYYIASVADRVFLYPKGSGALTGLATTQFFLKDGLDALGVDVQLIRHGKYKSAGEMYIRNDISPENREQYEVLFNSLWNSMLAEIAESRGIKAEDLVGWIDNLELSTADTWLDKGLIDGLKYRDEMEKYLCNLFGKTKAEEVKVVQITDYIKKVKKGPSDKKIAVIYADGEISRSGSEVVGEKLSNTIAKVRKDSTVKAVVFRVNSPGGEVVAADMIRREIELLQQYKPVIASYGSYAASGGYLISAGCEKIFVDNTTLTGSIGVFGMVPSYGRAIKKNLKVNPVVIGTNKHSAMGSSMQPLTEEEQEWYQKEIEGIYDDFVGVVAQGRSITKEYVDSIAQGRVWSGKDAIDIKLADEKGTLLDAIKYTAEKVELKKYRIQPIPEDKSIFKQMKDGDSGKKDNPLVRTLTEPGFKAMAILPFIPEETIKSLAQ